MYGGLSILPIKATEIKYHHAVIDARSALFSRLAGAFFGFTLSLLCYGIAREILFIIFKF